LVAEKPEKKSELSALYGDAEAQMGGADAIEKTTYVVGKGTDPEARSHGPSATVPSRGAPLIVMAVVIALTALVAAAYLIGVFR
jgi:hypothetical protein